MKRKVIMINSLGFQKGKNMAGEYIAEKYGYQQESFAEPIKKIYSTALGISEEELETYKNDTKKYKLVVEKHIEGSVVRKEIHNFREVLQYGGTEAIKPIFGDDVWAVLLLTNKILKSDKNIVITDFRFSIEDYKKWGYFVDGGKMMNMEFITIQINNDSVENNEKHSSENQLREYKFDYVIDNSSMDDSLFEEIDKIMQNV